MQVRSNCLFLCVDRLYCAIAVSPFKWRKTLHNVLEDNEVEEGEDREVEGGDNGAEQVSRQGLDDDTGLGQGDRSPEE